MLPDVYQRVVDELAMLEGADATFDHAQILAGEVTPVFFGSAVNNFGVQMLRDALPGWYVGDAGHNMGAAVGVLRASNDSRIKFLISLAGMAHTAAFAQREFSGVTPDTGCLWEKPECPLSQAYLDDMARIGSVVDAARLVRVPWLFLHGLADDVVPPQDSRDLFAVPGEPKQNIEMPEADHVFSEHHAASMASSVVAWMRQTKL